MAWKDSEKTEPIKIPLAELLKKEQFWSSAYNEPQTWKDELTSSHYSLIGEYDVDDSFILLRFELDENFRDKLFYGSSHFVNVLIDTKKGEAKIAEIPPAKLCPTCGKPV